jgi:hypothetical protein
MENVKYIFIKNCMIPYGDQNVLTINILSPTIDSSYIKDSRLFVCFVTFRFPQPQGP